MFFFSALDASKAFDSQSCQTYKKTFKTSKVLNFRFLEVFLKQKPKHSDFKLPVTGENCCISVYVVVFIAIPYLYT